MTSRRLFVALSLPEDIREALLDPMEGIPGARWQDADNLHVTLRFIGEVDRHQQADIAASLADLAFTPFSVRLAGVGHFEGNRRPKAIWARVEPSEQLLELQARIEAACRRAALPAETRKFVPHVTLARLNSGSGAIGPWLAKHGDLSLPAWRAETFSLFESNLTPNGAIYEEIAQFP